MKTPKFIMTSNLAVWHTDNLCNNKVLWQLLCGFEMWISAVQKEDKCIKPVTVVLSFLGKKVQ